MIKRVVDYRDALDRLLDSDDQELRIKARNKRYEVLYLYDELARQTSKRKKTSRTV